MKLQKLGFVILLLISFIMSTFPTTSYACSCLEPKSAAEELGKNSAVFSGKVIERADKNKGKWTQSSADQIAVLFEVQESWKGINQTQVIVVTERSSASCGYEFKVGSEYIVYANETDGALRANLCSRTALLSAASEDFEELGKSEKPLEQVKLDLNEGEERPFWIVLSFLVVIFGFVVFYSIKRVKNK